MLLRRLASLGAFGGRRGGCGLLAIPVPVRAMPLLAMLLVGGAAGAQTLAVSGACAQQCAAASPLVRENRAEVQACLIRCNAAQEFDRATGPPRPHPAAPNPHPRARPGNQAEPARAAGSRPPAVEAAALREARLAVPPASGRGPAPASAPDPTSRAVPHAVSATAAPAAVLRGVPQAAGVPAPAAGPPTAAPRAAHMAAAAGGPVAGRWGVAYLAAAPATGFGLAVGAADRLAAHAQAQSACGARGAPCRPALEFTERCGAVAQARRTLGLFRTADPRTYAVSYAAAGAGTTPDAAEGMALEACRARERTTGCEIVASACGQS